MVIKMELLSVIVPSYNEEENIFDFYEELMKNAPFFQSRELDVKVIYIDDGSKDKTAEKVKGLFGIDGLRFARPACPAAGHVQVYRRGL